MTKDEELAMDLALEALEKSTDNFPANVQHRKAITAIKQARSAPVQEPVAMRMPKVGDEVICIEDDSLGTVAYLTAGGSPEIRFDDGSHGTYMLREFAELFGYTTPPAAPVQEPVAHFGSAYVNENGVHITTVLGPVAIPQDAKLYTTPPNVATPLAAQRQSGRSAWVGLDDDDISALGLSIAKARALESLLKKRNT